MQCSARVLLGVAIATLTFPAPAGAHPGSGIVVDRQGNVYFVIGGSNVIMKLDRTGTATAFVTDARLRVTHHLVLSKDGGLYTASDDDGRVWHVGTDGSFQEHFNSNRVPRTARGQPVVEVGSGGDPFTVDSEGNVYALASTIDSAIVRITPRGVVTPIATNARFGGLHFASMAFGADGALYVSDANRVWRVVGDRATPIVPRGIQLSLAAGLAVDGGGNIYVADYRERRVVRFTSDGSVNTPKAIERLSLRNPTGVTLAGADVYVLDSPPGGVAVWRVRDGEAERLYSRRGSEVYVRWAVPALLMLLVVLAVWNRLRSAQRKGGALAGGTR